MESDLLNCLFPNSSINRVQFSPYRFHYIIYRCLKRFATKIMQIVKFHKVARTMHIIQFFNIASLYMYIPSADIPSLMQDKCILFYHKNLETFQFVNTIRKMYSTPAKMHIKVASCVKKNTMLWHKWQHLCPHIHKIVLCPLTHLISVWHAATPWCLQMQITNWITSSSNTNIFYGNKYKKEKIEMYGILYRDMIISFQNLFSFLMLIMSNQ